MQIKPQITNQRDNFPQPPPKEHTKAQNIIDQQLKFISEKLKLLNSQYDFSSYQLNKNINYLLGIRQLSQRYLKQFFKRKFIEEIKLLNDFYENAYTKSCINCLLFCCKLNWEKRFRIYMYTDEAFEQAIQDLPKERRDMFYFVNLLYIRLFIIYQENCAKIRPFKFMEASKMINILTQKIQYKEGQKQNKAQQFPILQKRNTQIEEIIQRDAKDLQANKKALSFNQDIKMLIQKAQQIEQKVKFQDTKVKTQHLFLQMSTKTLDLRNFLIRKSRVQGSKFVFVPMYDNLISFKFKLQFTNTQKIQQLQQRFEKFFLNSMRIAIKQKVIRMTKSNQSLNKQILGKFLHIIQEEKSLIHSSQFQSIADKEDQKSQSFWFQEFGQKLIKAIIAVSNQKIKQKHKKQSQLLSKRKKSVQVSKFKQPLQIKVDQSKKLKKSGVSKNPEDFYDSSRQFLSQSQI